MVSQHGRPDDGTDATGFFNAEFFVPLKPVDAWPGGIDKDKLTQHMTDALAEQFPGVDFNFSQYIQDNVEEAASGVKGENSVKIYGNDLETLEKKRKEIAARAGARCRASPILRCCTPWDSRRFASTSIGCARRASASHRATSTRSCKRRSAVKAPATCMKARSDRHFPMMVRLASALSAEPRCDPAAFPSRRPRARAGGVVQVPLDDVADVQLVSGASFIYREQQQRYVPIKFSVRGRDLGSAVLEAQRAVDAPGPPAGRLPPGMGG